MNNFDEKVLSVAETLGERAFQVVFSICKKTSETFDAVRLEHAGPLPIAENEFVLGSFDSRDTYNVSKMQSGRRARQSD